MHRSLLFVTGTAIVVAACSGGVTDSDTASGDATTVAASGLSDPSTTTEPAPAAEPSTNESSTTQPATTVPATTTEPAPTTAPTTQAPMTAPASTAPPTTEPGPTTTLTGMAAMAADAVQVVEFGRSVEDRPLFAVERGTPGGAVVLVIGVIHGDEADGVAILERLAISSVPDGVDLWLVESINPDGQSLPQRGNANDVDLNRNFPYEWGPIGQPGDGQYAGTGPASEPETQALINLVNSIQPDLTIWYHQDLFRLSPGQGFEGELKARYAELTGLPIEAITGGTYTGVAATWVRRTIDTPSFIVELGGDLLPEEADTHAAAVLEVAALVAAQPQS